MSIYLKKVNYEDIDKEYDTIINIPENENGLVNKYYNVTKDEFKNKVILELLNHAEGIDLVPGHVPDTYFFLWDDNEIVDFVVKTQKASVSLLQRKFKIGYNKAATMIDTLEENGIIGPATGNSKPREVLVQYSETEEEQ